MKNWNDIQSEKLFSIVFTKETPIKSIILDKIELYNSGSSIRLDFDLFNQLPDSPLKKWKDEGLNRCRLALDCNNIFNLSIVGNSICDIYNVEIVSDDSYTISIKNNDMNIKFQAQHISLCGPNMYLSE